MAQAEYLSGLPAEARVCGICHAAGDVHLRVHAGWAFFAHVGCAVTTVPPSVLEQVAVALAQRYFMQHLHADEPYLSDDGPTDSDDDVDDLAAAIDDSRIDDGDPSSSTGMRK